MLRNRFGLSGIEEESPHHPFRVEGIRICCFFRDDGLSDLIGFEYAKWHADDAVADLIHHLEHIQRFDVSTDKVVAIIMDGENTWEYFPDNGYYFLTALYKKLGDQNDDVFRVSRESGSSRGFAANVGRQLGLQHVFDLDRRCR